MSSHYYIYGYSFTGKDIKADIPESIYYQPVLDYLEEFLNTNILLGPQDQRPVVGFCNDRTGKYFIGFLSSAVSQGEVKNTSPCNLSINIKSALVKAWAKLDYFNDSARLEPGYYFF